MLRTRKAARRTLLQRAAAARYTAVYTCIYRFSFTNRHLPKKDSENEIALALTSRFTLHQNGSRSG